MSEGGTDLINLQLPFFALIGLVMVLTTVMFIMMLRERARKAMPKAVNLASEELMRKAEQQAEELLKQTKFFTEDVQEGLADQLDQTSAIVVSEANEAMRGVTDRMQQLAQRHVGALEDYLADQATQLQAEWDGIYAQEQESMRAMAKELSQRREEQTAQWQSFEQELQETRGLERSKVEAEMASYKKERMVRLEQELQQVLPGVLERVLGSAIGRDTQEKLARAAVQEATQELHE